MKFSNTRLYIVFIVALNGCSGTEIVNKTPEVNEMKERKCHVLKGENWQGSLDTTNEGYLLQVTGSVILPTPAYVIDWQSGPLDRRVPPALRLNITTEKPNGPVMQVLTTEEVNYLQKTSVSHYRHISVFCDDTKIGVILDIKATD